MTVQEQLASAIDVLNPFPLGDPFGWLTSLFVVIIWWLTLSAVWVQWRNRRLAAQLEAHTAALGADPSASFPPELSFVSSVVGRSPSETGNLSAWELLDAHSFMDESRRAARSRYVGFFPPQLVAALPGLLTALGILGTFVGLVLALSLASKGSESEAKEIIDGLSSAGKGTKLNVNDIINGLQVSFRTSVWGLLMSISLTWLNRQVVARVDDVCLKFARLVDRAKAVEEKQQLVAQLVESQQAVASAVVAFERRVPDAIGRSLQSCLLRPLREMVDRSAQRQAESLGPVIDRLTATLMEPLDVVAERLEELTGSLERTIQQLRVGAAQLEGASGATSQSANALRGAAQELKTSVTGLTATTKATDQLVTKWDGVAARLGENLEKTSKAITHQTTVIDSMSAQAKEERLAWKVLGDRLSNGFKVFGNSIRAEIERTLKEFDTELARVMKGLRGAPRVAEESLRTMVERLDQTRTALGQHTEAVASLSAAIAKQGASSESNAKSIREELVVAVGAFRGAIDAAVQGLDVPTAALPTPSTKASPAPEDGKGRRGLKLEQDT